MPKFRGDDPDKIILLLAKIIPIESKAAQGTVKIAAKAALAKE